MQRQSHLRRARWLIAQSLTRYADDFIDGTAEYTLTFSSGEVEALLLAIGGVLGKSSGDPTNWGRERSAYDKLTATGVWGEGGSAVEGEPEITY